MELEDLAFKPCPVVAVARGGPIVKVAVTKSGIIRISLNAEAYAKLGKPDCVAVGTAERGGARFMRLTPANLGEGWPLIERDIGGRTPSAQVSIKSHPWKPGVTHQAQAVECDWSESDVVVAMPDWAQILADIEAAESAE